MAKCSPTRFSLLSSLFYLSAVPDLFSPDGIAAWRTLLSASAEFREAAGRWSGTLLLVEGEAASPSRATWLALADGAIAEARPAEPIDRERAEFVLAAPAGTWADLIAGREELLMAALRGELRLERGQVFRLLPHARAASAMLRAAGDVES